MRSKSTVQSGGPILWARACSARPGSPPAARPGPACRGPRNGKAYPGADKRRSPVRSRLPPGGQQSRPSVTLPRSPPPPAHDLIHRQSRHTCPDDDEQHPPRSLFTPHPLGQGFRRGREKAGDGPVFHGNRARKDSAGPGSTRLPLFPWRLLGNLPCGCAKSGPELINVRQAILAHWADQQMGLQRRNL